jgi:hypothetical protein
MRLCCCLRCCRCDLALRLHQTCRLAWHQPCPHPVQLLLLSPRCDHLLLLGLWQPLLGCAPQSGLLWGVQVWVPQVWVRKGVPPWLAAAGVRLCQRQVRTVWRSDPRQLAEPCVQWFCSHGFCRSRLLCQLAVQPVIGQPTGL